jgi:hypothetical protein
MKEDTPKLTCPMPYPGGDYSYKKWLTELKLKEICEERGVLLTHLYAPHLSMGNTIMLPENPISSTLSPKVSQ